MNANSMDNSKDLETLIFRAMTVSNKLTIRVGYFFVHAMCFFIGPETNLVVTNCHIVEMLWNKFHKSELLINDIPISKNNIYVDSQHDIAFIKITSSEKTLIDFSKIDFSNSNMRSKPIKNNFVNQSNIRVPIFTIGQQSDNCIEICHGHIVRYSKGTINPIDSNHFLIDPINDRDYNFRY